MLWLNKAWNVQLSEYKNILIAGGSNIGDRAGNLNKALELMLDEGLITSAKRSSFYETEPVGYKDQDWFLNCVYYGKSNISPDILISELKMLESKMGRTKNLRWREREIDLDILIYGDLKIKDDNLEIPHPRMTERNFVLVPAKEVAPELVHPVFNKTINMLFQECKDSSVVQIVQEVL